MVEKKAPRRLERQADMSLAEMLSDLPTHLRGRNQAQRQGPYDELDRLQTASRCGRWGYPDQRRADLRFVARQPSRDPAGDDPVLIRTIAADFASNGE